MGTNQNAIQRAVVLAVTMICAGLDGAFDALICIAVHDFSPPSFGFTSSMAHKCRKKHGKISLFVAF